MGAGGGGEQHLYGQVAKLVNNAILETMKNLFNSKIMYFSFKW